MKLKTLFEAKKSEDKVVFKETDPQLPFPNDTITAIKKRINVFAKDLTTDWDSAVEMLDAVLMELKVPKPQAYLKERWRQYQELIEFTVENLYDSRGFGGNWNRVVK
jgi:hypothetical protein